MTPEQLNAFAALTTALSPILIAVIAMILQIVNIILTRRNAVIGQKSVVIGQANSDKLDDTAVVIDGHMKNLIAQSGKVQHLEGGAEGIVQQKASEKNTE
jgi:hypothetical protein